MRLSPVHRLINVRMHAKNESKPNHANISHQSNHIRMDWHIRVECAYGESGVVCVFGVTNVASIAIDCILDGKYFRY